MSNKISIDVLGLNTPQLEIKKGVWVELYRYTYREEQQLKKIVSESSSLTYEVKKTDVGKTLEALNAIQYKATEENDKAFAAFLGEVLTKRLTGKDNEAFDVDFILDLQGNIRDLVLHCLQYGQIPETYSKSE